MKQGEWIRTNIYKMIKASNKLWQNKNLPSIEISFGDFKESCNGFQESDNLY